jgi:hypothetical protein
MALVLSDLHTTSLAMIILLQENLFRTANSEITPYSGLLSGGKSLSEEVGRCDVIPKTESVS